jgi:hypothetical protein
MNTLIQFYSLKIFIINEKLIIEGASDKDDNVEVFETFDCPECKIVTELCEETKKALIQYYNDSVLRKIEEKQEEIKSEQKELKKSLERNKQNNSEVNLEKLVEI